MSLFESIDWVCCRGAQVCGFFGAIAFPLVHIKVIQRAVACLTELKLL